LRFERVDNLGAYRIPPETGLLIPSDYNSYRRGSQLQISCGRQGGYRSWPFSQEGEFLL